MRRPSLSQNGSRRTVSLAATLATVLAFATLTLTSCAPEPLERSQFTVVKVVDGDTIHIKNNQHQTLTVRLYGIDTPERGQPYGTAARKILAGLVAGETVTIEKKDVDKYGRTVARVYLGDTYVNLVMVEQGYAWWYRYFARFESDLKAAEARAREARLGLWSDPAPVPPWEWRRGRR